MFFIILNTNKYTKFLVSVAFLPLMAACNPGKIPSFPDLSETLGVGRTIQITSFNHALKAASKVRCTDIYAKMVRCHVEIEGAFAQPRLKGAFTIAKSNSAGTVSIYVKDESETQGLQSDNFKWWKAYAENKRASVAWATDTKLGQAFTRNCELSEGSSLEPAILQNGLKEMRLEGGMLIETSTIPLTSNMGLVLQTSANPGGNVGAQAKLVVSFNGQNVESKPLENTGNVLANPGYGQRDAYESRYNAGKRRVETSGKNYVCRFVH
jgi:hypothetical protein